MILLKHLDLLEPVAMTRDPCSISSHLSINLSIRHGPMVDSPSIIKDIYYQRVILILLLVFYNDIYNIIKIYDNVM